MSLRCVVVIDLPAAAAAPAPPPSPPTASSVPESPTPVSASVVMTEGESERARVLMEAALAAMADTTTLDEDSWRNWLNVRDVFSRGRDEHRFCELQLLYHYSEAERAGALQQAVALALGLAAAPSGTGGTPIDGASAAVVDDAAGASAAGAVSSPEPGNGKATAFTTLSLSALSP